MMVEIKHVYGQIKGPDMWWNKNCVAQLPVKKPKSKWPTTELLKSVILQPVAAANIPCIFLITTAVLDSKTFASNLRLMKILKEQVDIIIKIFITELRKGILCALIPSFGNR